MFNETSFNNQTLIRTKTVEAARAEADKIKLIGGAEASAIEAVGKAEAESMRQKASAYKQYGDAALMSLVLDALPKVSWSCIEYFAGFIHICVVVKLIWNIISGLVQWIKNWAVKLLLVLLLRFRECNKKYI